MNASSRTRVTTDGGDVTVTRTCPITGHRTTTTYFVSALSGYGYVRIRDRAGRFPQACEGLACTGATLRATSETLPAVIRRELHRLRRIDARIMAGR